MKNTNFMKIGRKISSVFVVQNEIVVKNSSRNILVSNELKIVRKNFGKPVKMVEKIGVAWYYYDKRLLKS